MIYLKSCFSFRTTNSRWKSVWKSCGTVVFFFFFLEVRPGLGLQRVLKEDFGFVSCVPSTISSFFKEVFLVQNETKGKKEFFGGIWGKATALDTTVQDSLLRSNSF